MAGKQKKSYKHHFVPRHLLKNFCYNNKFHLYRKKIKNKSQQKCKDIIKINKQIFLIHESDPKSSFYENDFNTCKLNLIVDGNFENYFSEIDGNSAKIIKSIISSNCLFKHEVFEENLKKCIICHSLRGKESRNRQLDILNKLEEFGYDINYYFYLFCLKNKEDYEEFLKITTYNNMVSIVNENPLKSYKLLLLKTKQQFIIGDNPLVQDVHETFKKRIKLLGYDFSGCEAYFPISDKYCLAFINEYAVFKFLFKCGLQYTDFLRYEQSGKPIVISENFTNRLNCLQFKNIIDEFCCNIGNKGNRAIKCLKRYKKINNVYSGIDERKKYLPEIAKNIFSNSSFKLRNETNSEFKNRVFPDLLLDYIVKGNRS